MSTPILTAEQLAGVHARLERADENIRNLNIEIRAFLNERPAGGFSEDKQQAAREYAKFRAERTVPLRLRVMAGEIAHHLRAALDYVAWNLSTEAYRLSDERKIGFPVLTEGPPTGNKRAFYNGQIQGITSAEAKAIIERVQPYHAANPFDDPLAIVHELDRVNKHQALVLVDNTWDFSITLPLPLTIGEVIIGPNVSYEDFVRRPKQKLKFEFTPQISFARLGQRTGQNVIPSLTHLSNAVRNIVNLFGP